jgi:hypothetical protein
MGDYAPTTWVDEVLAGDERYDIKDNGGTEIHGNVQIALKTSVSQAGTTVNAAKLNNLEAGVQNYAEAQTKSEKTTPVDADKFWMWDSVASALKHISWSGLKAVLKTYFDTLYIIVDSVAGNRVAQISICDANTVLITGDGAFGVRWYVPAEMNNMLMNDLQMNCSTASSSGLPTVQIANVTQGWDTLTTKLTLDANEKTSRTAATPFVIDTASNHNRLLTGDEIRFDIDGAGTGCKGVSVTVSAR